MTSRRRCDPSSTPSIASRPTTPSRSRDCRSWPARPVSASSPSAEAQELQSLKLQALRQGRAVGAVDRLLPQVQALSDAGGDPPASGPVFQPPFGPVLVVDGDAVRDVLERDQEFTVEPYGVEMMKVMSPAAQRRLQHLHPEHRRQRASTSRTSACCRRCATGRTPTRSPACIHQDCVRRVGAAVAAARASGASTIDVVQAVARYVPVTLGHRYLGVPVAPQAGILRADAGDADVLRRRPIDGQPDDGVDGTGGRRHSGRAADVPLDQGRVPALLQQRAEGSGRAGAGAARLPPAARVPPARDRHSASASAGRRAGRRHDADAAAPLSAGSFRAERGAAAPISIRAWSAICASPRTSWARSSAPSPARKKRRAASSTRSSGCRRASIERRARAATATAALTRPGSWPSTS